jgi:hypothetical protein
MTVFVKPAQSFLRPPSIAPARDDLSSPPATKWGEIVSGGRSGYQIVPDALIRLQRHLELTPGELNVLLNITMHWWESAKEQMPHPRPDQIANRMGVSTRAVQRCIRSMVKKGLIEWLPAKRHPLTRVPVRRFRLQPLCERLLELSGKVSEFEGAA